MLLYSIPADYFPGNKYLIMYDLPNSYGMSGGSDDLLVSDVSLFNVILLLLTGSVCSINTSASNASSVKKKRETCKLSSLMNVTNYLMYFIVSPRLHSNICALNIYEMQTMELQLLCYFLWIYSISMWVLYISKLYTSGLKFALIIPV